MKHGAKKIWKNIGIAVVCLCVFSYAVFHVASLFSEEIGTIVVGPTTERTTTKLSGYIFRDAELVYPENYNGAVDYLVENGEKVSAKSELATVYSEGSSADIKGLLAVIDEQLVLLRGTTDDVPPVSRLTSLRKSASDAYYSIMKQLSSGSDFTIDANKKKLLVSLNSIAAITDEDFKIKDTSARAVTARRYLPNAADIFIRPLTDMRIPFRVLPRKSSQEMNCLSFLKILCLIPQALRVLEKCPIILLGILPRK